MHLKQSKRSGPMSIFQCLTCVETLEAEPMMKHLSVTRHKSIEDAHSEEEISCEECQNSNIHQLQIIRFGGEDMSLLCKSCFGKEYTDSEKPSTLYSLSNGSFLKYWPLYKRVRDCACENCGNESYLNVNDKRKVICNTCLNLLNKKEADKFTSESSGQFLYAYLGIKEPSGNKNKNVRKKGGRRIGRGRRGRCTPNPKKPREKKPLTVHQQIAKTAYTIKQQNNTIDSENNISLRSFKGVNADNTSKSSYISRANPAGHKKKENGHIKTTKNDTKTQLKTEKYSSTNKSEKSKRFSNETPKSFIPSNSSSLPKQTRSAKPTRTDKANSSFRENNQKVVEKNIPKGLTKKREEVIEKKNNVKQKENYTRNDKNGSSVAGLKSDSKTKYDPRKKDKRHTEKPMSNKRDKDSSVLKSKRLPNDPKTDQENKNNKNTNKFERRSRDFKESKLPAVNESAKKVDEIEEGEILEKYTNYSPKLTYSDLDSYFKELSYALFLEQKLDSDYDFMHDFQIMWPSSADANFFVVNIKSNSNPEFDKLISPEMLKLGRLPFTKRQPLLLVSNDETKIWFSYVKEAELKRNVLKVLLELYPWNKVCLPVNLPSADFKILPCSAQTNRIFFAMTKIKNPKFIDLILGQKPVKQISFQNRLQFTNDRFNESQKSAIQHVLNNSVTILQGPPGTGKTSTIEEIILQLIRNFNSFPILCVAASNIAIDNIAEKFVKNWPDIKILRIVSDGKESQYNSEHPLGKICLHNIVNEQLPPTIKDNLINLRTGRAKSVSKNQYNKLLTCQNDISDRHVLQARIIFTTNIAAGGRQLKAIQQLPVVIMDESTQSSEASTLVPLSLPGIRTFVFVGDQKQLSSFSNVPQLKMSLFERVLLNGCYTKPHMLDTQYRMHPKISEFPRKEFYNDELKDGVSCETKSWPNIKYPLYFYHCDKGTESKVFSNKKGIRGFTYNNHHESDEIIKILYKLILDKGVKNNQIGIITPYSAQRDLLSEMLVKDRVINPQNIAMEQEVDESDSLLAGPGQNKGPKRNTINIINGVFVSTIDSFQGHEKNFIIFSCVRNNKENKIGFVSDKRRMNVALTRAKNGLIIVGNKNVLSAGDQLWSRYVQYLEQNKVIFNSLDVY